ncbi:MAG: helicase-related protein [Akkermansia sp.]
MPLRRTHHEKGHGTRAGARRTDFPAAQPRENHRTVPGPHPGPGAQGPHRHRPRTDAQGRAGEGHAHLRAGKADILLATTIIESGIDIPNANTIIIDRADRFGLADLYQLRGRVGRAGHRAYAYLMLPRSAATTETPASASPPSSSTRSWVPASR